MQGRGRDDLIDDVQHGRMTPEAAEAEAVRLGLPPIAPKPDPDSFNPMGEAWWTLVMALAWISWRSPRKVCEFWDVYRCECWDWTYLDTQGRGNGRWYLEQRKPATLSRLMYEATYDKAHDLVPDGWIGIEDAKAKLWAALSDDALQATGMARPNGGERVAIPDHEWRDLAPFEENARTVLFVRRGDLLSSGGGYNDVTLRRQNVMALWPPHRGEVLLERLPTVMKPDGAGYMPLVCAAQWIATRGGSVDFPPKDVSRWRDAFAELLDRIASEHVTVTGIRDNVREKLSGHLFASCLVDYPYQEVPTSVIFSEELYLSSAPYDAQWWDRGYDDSLRNRWGVKWAKLMVLKSDVARWWPFASDSGASSESDPIYDTGAPGRPSSRRLVEIEHAARWDRGEAIEKIGAEANALAQWLKQTHPKAPPLTAKTIRNTLGAEHRRRLAVARK
jgi:hypothetical protein